MPSIFPNGTISSVADLGFVVRAQRKAADVTQAEAAGLCGVGVRFMSELERGKVTLEVGKVMQVLDRLGLQLRISPRGVHPSVGHL